MLYTSIYIFYFFLYLWRLEIINNYELCRNCSAVDKVDFDGKMNWKKYNYALKLFPVLFENSLFFNPTYEN